MGLLKQCNKCGETKPIVDFQLRTDTGSRRGDCRQCRSADNLKRYHTKPSTRESHRIASRRHAVRTKYGLDEAAYEDLLCYSDGKCFVCGAVPPKGRYHHIDHDHITGVVRGLLCHGCNVSLGHTKEDPEILRKLANYLEEHNAKVHS